MSGGIEFDIRKGKTNYQRGKSQNKHPIFDEIIGFYPEWYLKITSEDNNSLATISPSLHMMAELIKYIVLYERISQHDLNKITQDEKGKASSQFQLAIREAESIDLEKIRGQFIDNLPVYKEAYNKANPLKRKE